MDLKAPDEQALQSDQYFESQFHLSIVSKYYLF